MISYFLFFYVTQGRFGIWAPRKTFLRSSRNIHMSIGDSHDVPFPFVNWSAVSSCCLFYVSECWAEDNLLTPEEGKRRGSSKSVKGIESYKTLWRPGEKSVAGDKEKPRGHITSLLSLPCEMKLSAVYINN